MTTPQAPNPELVMRYAWGYAPPLILEAALRHKVFDHLTAGPKTAGELATATGCSERGLRILLNAVVGLELLTRNDAGKYALTPESATFLVSTKPGYLGGFYKHTSDQILPKWLQLNEIVRTGKPAAAVNQQGDGSAFFAEFVEDLFPMGWPAAQGLAAHLKIAEAKQPVSVLDLAAGSGVWSIALAKASPNVRVTAVDWEGVLPTTRKVTERHGVADRYTFVAGDLDSANFGTGHHIATLGHILHSEGAERSQALLKKTAAALAPGGTIAIAEFLVDADRRGPLGGLIFGVNMLVHTDQGDTFSFAEIANWLHEAGFTNARLLEGPGPSPLILATRA
jgi:SAM-dependent methyltransferase